MNGLDWFFVFILVIFTVLGAYWGVIRQVLAIAGLVAGIAIAGRNYADFADVLANIITPDAPAILNVVAFALIMFAVSLVVSIIATLLRLFVGLLFLGWLDHALGAILGFLQGGLLIAALLAVMVAFPTVGISDTIQASKIAHYWRIPVKIGLWLMPEQFRPMNEIVFDL